jgi:hypothetical protein
MIESDRFADKKDLWFRLQRKSSGDWGNPQAGTHRRPLILNMYGLGILSMTGLSKEAVAGS